MKMEIITLNGTKTGGKLCFSIIEKSFIFISAPRNGA